MAVVTTNLGTVTAYGDAVAAGYTGTKEQWQALMADYATVGTQAAQDAQTASTAATTATTAAQTATTKAGEASASATAAAASAASIGTPDTTLTQSGKAADAKAVGDELNTIKEDLNDINERVEALEQGGTGGGLTEAVKVALLQIAQKVAYIDADGQDYYDDLYDALYPPASLVSISAVYSGGAVTDDTPLNDLKTDLTVTASYDDSTTAIVTDYTLSGTLTEGTSTITVSYGGKTTTFTVTVTHAVTEELWIDGLATGSTAGFNFAPFVLPASTYEYDYTKSITAIETEFVSAGVISVGYYSGTVDTQTVPSDSDTHIHEVLTVSATGQHKLSLSTPMSIPSGAVLLVGQSTDTATFKYGGTLTNGFAYRDVNGQHYFKFQSKKLGINVYRQ